MTFEQIWSKLLEKDERLNQGDTMIAFTSANLKRLLQQVYDQGVKQAKDTDKLIGELFGGLGGNR